MTMDIYNELGVQKWVNGWDTISGIGGSIMKPGTMNAMMNAPLDEQADTEWLKRKGEELAELTGNRAACVTPGTSAGIMLAVNTAVACSQSRRIVMMCSHRNHYDHAVYMGGGVIHQIGISWTTDEWELAGALSEKPAALLFIASQKHSRSGLPLTDCVRLAKKYGVPVIVDAAAQIPPVKSLWEYTACGADIALFSGGKALRASQSVGFAAGTGDFIERMNQTRAQNRALQNLMPIGKGQTMALLSAVRDMVSSESEAQIVEHTRLLSEMMEGMLVRENAYRAATVQGTAVGQNMVCCHVRMRDRNAAKDIADKLRDRHGTLVGLNSLEPEIIINPFALTEDEAKRIACAMLQLAGVKSDGCC